MHIWWARRPLAACRAVLCATLWLDPVDKLCPEEFVLKAKELISDFAKKHLDLVSTESYKRFHNISKNKEVLSDPIELRFALLDFIADFANWDNSTNEYFIETSNKLTESSHIALGGELGTKPLVVDPFAGGGSIPLEAIRVGADTVASDLNPVAVLLNKVMLEYIPKYGQKLTTDVRKWGMWIKEQAEKELSGYYPKDKNGSIPIAYLWARTVTCEGPGCGSEIPLIQSLWLSKKGKNSVALKLKPNKKQKRVDFEIINNVKERDVEEGTVKRGSAICPCCKYITPVTSVRKQLQENKGGAKNATLFCVVTVKKNENGRSYRIPTIQDIDIQMRTKDVLIKTIKSHKGNLSLVPDELFPVMSGVFNAPLYGHDTWGSIFGNRQSLTLITLIKYLSLVKNEINRNDEYSKALLACLGIIIDRQADSLSSLTRWQSSRETNSNTFGRQALPIVWDFAEPNSFSDSSGGMKNAIEWVCRIIEELKIVKGKASVYQRSATNTLLPDQSVETIFTDPPYYNAVPYADLSDFFYVWLKRSIGDIFPDLFSESLSPKKEEICEMSGWDSVRYSNKDSNWYEKQMNNAMIECDRILKNNGICTLVFAHKTTKGWESQLQAMLDAGFVFTASWPIDTEMGSRLRAMNSAALASSIHLVCRPRISTKENVGDWQQVLTELPLRIHEWMPRLANEGVAGADAIFACLGPALEIFSKYQIVEKPNGDVVTLGEYLEHVWAAVSKEALSLVFKDAETSGFEEDARISAMWLWTLMAGKENGIESKDIESEDDESSKKGKIKIKGFMLEYDTARKIAQGLGANLEDMQSVIEIKGDKARLLPVEERMSYLFGKDDPHKQLKKKRSAQKSLFDESTADDEYRTSHIVSFAESGKTVLDRLHQSMLYFSGGRTDALKKFLVEEGAGNDDKFWKLAQALSALYPKESDEKRWVDGVQTYKKSLGF